MSEGVIAVVAVLAAATAFGLVWRRAQGRLRAPAGPGPGQPVLTAADLGHALGRRATLLQFSTAFCAPCGPTRQMLAEVADPLDGVAHVEIDAESRLDLARRLNVYSTPTVLVLGPDGGIVRRGSGQPRRADIVAVLDEMVLGGQQAAGRAAAPAPPESP